jgi:diguanylate cyclase
VGPNLVTLAIDRSAVPEKHADDGLRQTLDAGLEALSDVVAATDAGAAGAIVSSIAQCRHALAAHVPDAEIDAPARACFDDARRTAAALRTQAAERREQTALLARALHDAVAALDGEHGRFEDTLAGAAERVERARGEDVALIQQRLLAELTTLKRVAVDRRAAWQQTHRELESRLTRLESQLEHSRREAATDPLTGIANRRTLEQACLEWLDRTSGGFVLAVADVDNFKQVNDRYGHQVGDRVLVAVAEGLTAGLRSDDVVARQGGDEFACLAGGMTLQQAERRFAAISASVQQACRTIVPEGPVPSLSVGLAERSAGDTVHSLHARADAALYQAKRAGKGRVAVKDTPFIRDLLRGRRRS